jgi:hypothetical protein
VSDDVTIDDRRLHGADRGEHPHDCPGPGIRIVRQQAGMALSDMEHDGSGLEEGEVTFFIGRNLPERMKLRCADAFIALNERRRTS